MSTAIATRDFTARNRLPAAPPAPAGWLEETLRQQVNNLRGIIAQQVHDADVKLRDEIIAMRKRDREHVTTALVQTMERIDNTAAPLAHAVEHLTVEVNDLRHQLAEARAELQEARAAHGRLQGELEVALSMIRSDITALRADAPALIEANTNAIKTLLNRPTRKTIQYDSYGRPSDIVMQTTDDK